MTLVKPSTTQFYDSPTMIAAHNHGAIATKANSTALPRFNLRKRSVSTDREKANLATVNSAFLTGLFADVANVESNDTESSSDDSVGVVSLDARPFKKSRASMNKSISRCGRSFKNLRQLSMESPLGVMDLFKASFSAENAPMLPMSSHDSLYFQLNCVSGDSVVKPDTVLDAIELAFPHLPATVSNSSCSTLTRNLSDLQSSLTESEEKDSYGWFVAVDDESTNRDIADPYANAKNLAFVAPTAPNAVNHDAEVEWAQAADTVDDVLGDFF